MARSRSTSRARSASASKRGKKAQSSTGTTFLTAGTKNQFKVTVPSADLPLREIRESIPAHYFERPMLTSAYYVARDIAQGVLTAYVMYHYGIMAMNKAIAVTDAHFGAGSYEAIGVSWLIKLLVWNVFWFVQGLNGTGIWVMAHECGHQAFSNYRVVNDMVGWFLHSALLVPYHSWRISHGNHHKHTNHLTKDTVFVPESKDKASPVSEAINESPIVSTFMIIVMLTLGWPGYLLANMAGQKYSRRANHFEPSSPLFRPADASDIVFSDFGVILALGAVGYAVHVFSFVNVFCWYLAPYLWVNAWLVFITYMQHTDIRLPHYADSEWNFVRGAVATVDRNYGFMVNWWLHHINDSHAVHHLFSQMPFYHAIKVTRNHIRDILGDAYLTDNRSLFTALMESWTECRYVVPTDGVSVFHR